MKTIIGECAKCGKATGVNLSTEKPTCIICGEPIPVTYEDEPEDGILTKELFIGKGFGWSLIGVEEQETRAIENGADEEILYYVPYAVFQQDDKTVRKYVNETIC